MNRARERRWPVTAGHRAPFVVGVVACAVLAPAAWAQIDVPSGLADVHRAAPGDVIEGTVRVSNDGARPRTVALSLWDHRVRPDGDGWVAAGSLPRSAAPWIDVPSVVRVGPGETREVAYRLRVPPHGVDGTYWATLMVRPRYEENAATGGSARTEVGLRPVRRFAVELVADVGGAERSHLAIDDVGLERDGDALALHLALHNEGGRWVRRPSLEARVLDPETGERVHTVRTGVRTLYPGAGTRARLELGDLPSRRLRLLVLARDDAGDVAAVRFDLDPPPDP